jgi:hypothetical protein
MPSQGTENRAVQQKITRLPQNETIVGFAFAQAFSYGISGRATGRSRTTADLQFYVHNNYTRKGIGRCLLDRLVQCLSFAYGAKDGYSWMDFGENQVYKQGGSIYLHQLLIQLPIKAKDDPNLVWITAFLKKYWFLTETTLPETGRSPADSNQSEFLDTALFCYEAMVASDFPCTV